MPSASRELRLAQWLSLALFLVTFLIYSHSLGNDFVNFDDPQTVASEPAITSGISAEGILWAFTHQVTGVWHPLTTISHQLVWQLFGGNPWFHHLVNVLLHAAAAGVCFLALRALTGATWRSAFVAALFALHPLRVESVAWVTERKDVLSGLLFLLALWNYALYVRRETPGRYLVVSMLFAGALLAKPMVVTFPFVLLLLDYWPLGRFATRSFRRLLVEKLPLFALAALDSIAQMIAIQGLAPALPVLDRVDKISVGYAAYLGKTFWPADLAVYYPFTPASPATWLACAAVPAVFSILALLLRRRRPAFFVGWFWFVGMLVPVIGLVSAGPEAFADRFTYLPSIGLAITGVWLASEATPVRHRITLAWGGIGVLLAAAILSWGQTSQWKNSETLFRHALAVTKGNAVAHSHLGTALVTQGRLPEARAEYEAALQIDATQFDVHDNLGVLELTTPGGRPDAIAHFQTALRLNPNDAAAYGNLGIALAQGGRRDAAIESFESALRLAPDNANLHCNFASLFLRVPRDRPRAVAHLQTALRLDPDFARARQALNKLEAEPENP